MVSTPLGGNPAHFGFLASKILNDSDQGTAKDTQDSYQSIALAIAYVQESAPLLGLGGGSSLFSLPDTAQEFEAAVESDLETVLRRRATHGSEPGSSRTL